SSDGPDVSALVQGVRDKWCEIDILVNNAGIGHTPQALDTLSEETFDRILGINAKSVFLTAREIVPAMKARKGGQTPTSLPRRRQSPAQSHLVQRFQGLDDHRHPRHGGGAG